MRSLLCLSAVLIPTVASAAKPIALHPGNPHYFVWRGKPTVLVTSGEHYGALLNLDFDYARYFDTLHADGLNHTRTFSGVYREDPKSFGITDNPLAPKAGRYLCPWARSSRPGYAGGGNKFDLTKWDPAYFRRLRDFMTKAGQRGIVVEMNLFCPMYNDALWRLCPMNAANNVNGVGRCGRTEVYTLKHKTLLAAQLTFVRKIVAELRDFDNLYYEVCNEPYFGGVTVAWQHKVVDAIVDAEKRFPARHLISMNIANGRKKVSMPHRGVSIFNFHYCTPPNTVAMNYGLKKVIGENETGFRGKADVLYRTEGWDFLLAGGGLYNNLDYSFTAKHADGKFLKYTSPGGGSPALRRQLGILKTFLHGFDFVRMQPDPDVVRGATPKLAATALAERGKAYAVYLHVPLPAKPKDLRKLLRKDITARLTLALPAGRYRAEWIDTKTGKTEKDETFSHSGNGKTLVSPRFTNDVALRVRRASRK
jgi:hypothetical protein